MLWQWKCTAALALILCSALPPHHTPALPGMPVLSPTCLLLIQRVAVTGCGVSGALFSQLLDHSGEIKKHVQLTLHPGLEQPPSVLVAGVTVGSPSRLMTSSVSCIRGRILEKEKDRQPQLSVFHPDHCIRLLWCCLLPWTIGLYCPILTAKCRTVKWEMCILSQHILNTNLTAKLPPPWQGQGFLGDTQNLSYSMVKGLAFFPLHTLNSARIKRADSQGTAWCGERVMQHHVCGHGPTCLRFFLKW